MKLLIAKEWEGKRETTVHVRLVENRQGKRTWVVILMKYFVGVRYSFTNRRDAMTEARALLHNPTTAIKQLERFLPPQKRVKWLS